MAVVALPLISRQASLIAVVALMAIAIAATSLCKSPTANTTATAESPPASVSSPGYLGSTIASPLSSLAQPTPVPSPTVNQPFVQPFRKPFQPIQVSFEEPLDGAKGPTLPSASAGANAQPAEELPTGQPLPPLSRAGRTNRRGVFELASVRARNPGDYEVGSNGRMQASFSNGLVFQSANGDFYTHVGGMTQFDMTAFQSDPQLNASPFVGRHRADQRFGLFPPGTSAHRRPHVRPDRMGGRVRLRQCDLRFQNARQSARLSGPGADARPHGSVCPLPAIAAAWAISRSAISRNRSASSTW